MAGYLRQDITGNIATGNVINALDLNNEFNAVVAAFSSSTGHKHDGTTGEGARITIIGPSGEIAVVGGNLRPSTTDIVDLGTSALKYKNGYFSGTVTATNFVGPFTGSATSAETLTTPRTIGLSGAATAAGVSFNGSSNITIPVTGLNASNLNSGTVPSSRISGNYSGITVVGPLTGGSIQSGFGNINIGSNQFTGNGVNITNLNASALASGVIPDARLSGAYTGFTNLTASGTGAFNTLLAASGGSIASPKYSFNGNTGYGIHFVTGTSAVTTVTSGAARLSVTDGAITAGSGVVFTGNGSGLTSLNADNFSSGRVPNAQITGTYSGLDNMTGSGTATFAVFQSSATRGFRGNGSDTANAPSFTWAEDVNTGIYRSGEDAIGFSAGGSRRARITNDGLYLDAGVSFNGNGINITSIDAANITTGKIDASILPDNAAGRDYVLGRTAVAAAGAVGTYAMLRQTGTGSRSFGENVAGSSLRLSNAGGTIGSTPSGTWKCMGETPGGASTDVQNTTLWLRIT